jgi:hypothetical protein
MIEQRERCESEAENLPLKSSRVTPGAGLSFAGHSQPPRGQCRVADLFEIIPPKKDSERVVPLLISAWL